MSMTREERLEYCRGCSLREHNYEGGIVCSLTGEQATFDEGCKDYKEDINARRLISYREKEKRRDIEGTIESVASAMTMSLFFVPFIISCVAEFIFDNRPLFGKMAMVTATYAALGVVLIILLFLFRKIRRPQNKDYNKLSTVSEMMSVIREEGKFPFLNEDREISFTSNDMTISYGILQHGFKYGRLYYNLSKEYKWKALIAGQCVEQTFAAVKVMIVPGNESVIFSVETYCDNKEDFRLFVNQSCSILADSVSTFTAQLNEMEMVSTEEITPIITINANI